MIEITNSELSLIGLVAEGLGYGYQIEGALEARGMREWTEIGFSSIYYSLNRLEAAGWLRSERTEGGARPGRRVYELTPAGREIYRSEVLERLSNDRPHSSDFDLALANLPALEPDGRPLLIEALGKRRRRLEEKIAEVEAKWQAAGRGHIPFFVDAVFDHGLAQMHAELAWLDRFIKTRSEHTEHTDG
ncbi:MAG: helix-turn-helix transcriptional regulator [Anaerolineaceae bacterium]